jgi:molybdopterin converting factor subunit 1
MSQAIEVKFFASLREQVGVAQLQIGVTSLDALRDALQEQLSEDKFEHLLAPNIRLAINQELVEGNWRESSLALANGDEVAFLPPVTGG